MSSIRTQINLHYLLVLKVLVKTCAGWPNGLCAGLQIEWSEYKSMIVFGGWGSGGGVQMMLCCVLG